MLSPRTPPRASPPAAPTAAAVTNETLAWELLYNMGYQLPTEEAETSWRDATGETNVMLEGMPQIDNLQPPEMAMKAAQMRIRRIAEAAFWDSLAGKFRA